MMTRSLLGLTAALLASPAAAQSTTRVSVDSLGGQSDRRCNSPTLSADGRFVAFFSGSEILVPGDSNHRGDVFMHDRQTGVTSLVAFNSQGQQGDGLSESPSLSADGRYVAFGSFSTNLVRGDDNNEGDVFVRDRQTGRTIRVSVNSAGGQGNSTSLNPAISADGRCVTFESFATNLVPGDTNLLLDVFAHDLSTGQTTRVSVNSSGLEANGQSVRPTISLDGRFIAFGSLANNLVPGDTNSASDVFVHDRTTGVTRLCSTNSNGQPGNLWSSDPSLSGDGSLVAFISEANDLVPGDANGVMDVFVHDLRDSRTTRLNLDSSGLQVTFAGNGPALSANGQSICFAGISTLTFGEVNGLIDLYVHDRGTGRTSLVTVDSAGQERNGTYYGMYLGGISADGRIVAFGSDSTNLVPGDTNGEFDSFVRDRGLVGPVLSLAGSCPGPLAFTVRSATPSGRIAIACGAAGTFVKPAQPCSGAVLSLGPPLAGSILIHADGSGSAVLNLHVGAGFCGLSVQAVDLTTCAATNVLIL